VVGVRITHTGLSAWASRLIIHYNERSSVNGHPASADVLQAAAASTEPAAALSVVSV
jgi:hypothetical protein